MIKLTFKKDSDASDFASELLEAHEKTQICYKYERDCEIAFWWEYQTDIMSEERDDEEEKRRVMVDQLFKYLDDNGVEYK